MDSRYDDFIHILRLDPGDKIIASLLNYLADKEDLIPSGFLTGLGAIDSCEIGWANLVEQEYKTHLVEEACEITSLIGNISWVDGKPFVHAHITLGRQDYSIIGGHLVEGTISATAEIYIHLANTKISRKPGMFSKLKVIDFGE